jgi:hypothetical protein
LVASFYPETKVSYDAMKMKLITTFGRCSRPTILAYLGRPETRQKETVSHLVQYSKSGTTTNKTHTFVHKLPKRRGYVELFGLASLHQDFRTGKVWFRLFHTEQTKIDSPSPLTNPQHESCPQKETMYEVDEEFNEALAYAKHQVSEKLTTKNFSFLNSGSVGVNEKSVLQVKRDVGRDRERERDIKQRKKIEVSESKLSDEEKLLFSALDRSCREAS